MKYLQTLHSIIHVYVLFYYTTTVWRAWLILHLRLFQVSAKSFLTTVMTFNSFSLFKSGTVCYSCFFFIMIQIKKSRYFLNWYHIFNVLINQINDIISMPTMINFFLNQIFVLWLANIYRIHFGTSYFEFELKTIFWTKNTESKFPENQFFNPNISAMSRPIKKRISVSY